MGKWFLNKLINQNKSLQALKNKHLLLKKIPTLVSAHRFRTIGCPSPPSALGLETKGWGYKKEERNYNLDMWC